MALTSGQRHVDVRLSVTSVETIPPGMTVRDYDQLDTEAKLFLAERAQSETAITVPQRVGAAFERRELVKYTDFLCIRKDEVFGGRDG